MQLYQVDALIVKCTHSEKVSNCPRSPQKLFLPVGPIRGNRLLVAQAKNLGFFIILLFPHFRHPSLLRTPPSSHFSPPGIKPLLPTTGAVDNCGSLRAGPLAFPFAPLPSPCHTAVEVLPKCQPSPVDPMFKTGAEFN